MKLIGSILCLWLLNVNRLPNKTVESFNPTNYSGTWYSLYSIPTSYDKGSRETTGRYVWNKKGGYFDVTTTFKKPGSEEVHQVSSKVFKGESKAAGQMKCQFVWPFKLDYWVIELASDYSYAVVGHPEHKLLFIMSRKKDMDKTLYKSIVDRCEARGYKVEQLASQKHAD